MEDLDFMDDFQDINYVIDETVPLGGYIVHERYNPANYNDKDFIDRFGFTKASVQVLCDMLRYELSNSTNWNYAVSVELQVLCALRILRVGTFQRVGGDLLHIHRTTAGYIFHKFISAVTRLRSQFITFPETEDEIKKCKQEFYAISDFPDVVGAIDCTHVRILCPPGEQAETFRNRKGQFSINVQLICDAQLRIRNVVSRWPGSTHDSTIWNSCSICEVAERGELGGLLIGDGGYAAKNYMLTPVRNPTTAAERQYNNSHAATRNAIERTNGVLKKRFHILDSKMRYDPVKCAKVIVACSILHNFAIDMKEVTPPVRTVRLEEQAVGYEGAGDLAGMAFRRAFIVEHFS